MKYVVKNLAFPGSILHPKKGRIELYKLNQGKLRDLYNEGSKYVALVPGDPPNEQDIEVKSTPTAGKKPVAGKKQKASKKNTADQSAGNEPASEGAI